MGGDVIGSAKATFQAAYWAIIDAAHVKWPTAKVYLMSPWKQGNDNASATMAGWITEIVAARPGVAFQGPNESVWLKASDNGVKETMDGIHYSETGNLLCAQQWQALLGL